MDLSTARPSADAADSALAQPVRALQRRRRFMLTLAAAAVGLVLLGLCVGSAGLSWQALRADLAGDQAWLIVGEIRAPRTLGALLVGALLGLAGAVAQGLFRNPLADPFLLGSAAGASLAVVAVLAAGSLAGHVISLATAVLLERLGLVVAAFAGALVGVALTLSLARGAANSVRLLLAGVVVGVLMGAANELITLAAPEALRGRQMFMLGSTSFLGWTGVAVLAAGLALALPLARHLARVLDALTLGEHTALSLGLPLNRLRLLLVGVFALATGLAVSQAGLVSFVGLAAPHLVRRAAPGAHGHLLLASACTGGVLLLAADVLARAALAPQELPVGVITALVGGSYLLWLLRRKDFS
jgi:iron complex transport system permease protein